MDETMRLATRLCVALAVAASGCGGDRHRDASPGDGGGSDAGSSSECDRDGDGFRRESCGTINADCDDGDATIHPSAPDGHWQLEELVAAEDYDVIEADVAVAPDGTVHVLAIGADLRLWSRAGGAWSSEVISSSITRGRPAIAVSGSGGVHVAYVDGEGVLQHALRADGSWTFSPVAPGSRIAAIAVDASGAPVIAHQSDIEIRVSRNAGGTWTSETLDVSRRGAGRDMCLVVDDAGAAHVVYDHIDDGIMYVTTAPVAHPRLMVEGTSDDGSYCRLARGAAGELHLAFRRMGTASVFRADDSSGVLFGESTGLDPAPDSTRVGIVLVDGVEHIAYARRGGLASHAWRAGDAFVSEVIDTNGSHGWPGWEAAYARIAAGPDGMLWVAYGNGRDLYIAERVGDDGIDQDCDGVAGE